MSSNRLNEIQEDDSSDESVSAEQIAHELLHTEDIPPVSALVAENAGPNPLYRFSAPVLLNQVKSVADGSTSLNVTGIEGDVRFEGNTAPTEWYTDNHLRTALNVDEPYPFQGVVTPIAEIRRMADGVEYAVEFLVLVAPTEHQYQRWHNRQALINEQYESMYGYD